MRPVSTLPLPEGQRRNLVLDSPVGGGRKLARVAVWRQRTQEGLMSNTAIAPADVIRRYFELDADRDDRLDRRSVRRRRDRRRRGRDASRDRRDPRLADRPRVEVHVHDRGPRHDRARRGPVRGHGPPDGQLPRRHRRAEVGLHRRRRPDHAGWSSPRDDRAGDPDRGPHRQARARQRRHPRDRRRHRGTSEGRRGTRDGDRPGTLPSTSPRTTSSPRTSRPSRGPTP